MFSLLKVSQLLQHHFTLNEVSFSLKFKKSTLKFEIST